MLDALVNLNVKNRKVNRKIFNERKIGINSLTLKIELSMILIKSPFSGLLIRKSKQVLSLDLD